MSVMEKTKLLEKLRYRPTS